jgi:hypothetical protein
MSGIPCGDPHAGPHPADDDINDMSDLPPEVVLNVSHPEPTTTQPIATPVHELIDALHDLTEEIAAMRVALEKYRMAPTWHIIGNPMPPATGTYSWPPNTAP